MGTAEPGGALGRGGDRGCPPDRVCGEIAAGPSVPGRDQWVQGPARRVQSRWGTRPAPGPVRGKQVVRLTAAPGGKGKPKRGFLVFCFLKGGLCERKPRVVSGPSQVFTRPPSKHRGRPAAGAPVAARRPVLWPLSLLCLLERDPFLEAPSPRRPPLCREHGLAVPTRVCLGPARGRSPDGVCRGPQESPPLPRPVRLSPRRFLLPRIPGLCYADAPRQHRLPFPPAFVPPQGDYLGPPPAAGCGELTGAGRARGSLGLPHAWGVPSVGLTNKAAADVGAQVCGHEPCFLLGEHLGDAPPRAWPPSACCTTSQGRCRRVSPRPRADPLPCAALGPPHRR